MSEFFELSHKTEAVMENSAKLADKMGFDASAQTIREQLEALRKKELMVVVAGEVKRGKSSLLNALLNEKEPLFPVDVNACTNVVTIARYGETEVIEAYIEDQKAGGKCRVEKLSREQIADYVSEKGNPGNYKQVKLICAYIPNDLLKEGVVFVDTPGVGSLNIEHAETTYSFLPNADVLLFVGDADSGLTESELKFLKRGYKYCKNILFPLTKKDLNANYKTIEDDNRKKISQTLNIPSDNVQIVSVSSAAKLRYLKNGSKSMLANSNYPALEDAIWTSIAMRRGEIMLLPFLNTARNELLKLLDSVAAQYQMLGADQSVAKGLMDKLNQKKEDLKNLQDKGAKWRGQLTSFFKKLQNSIDQDKNKLNMYANELVDNRVESLSDRICKEENYTQLIHDVNDLISLGVINIKDKIASEVGAETNDLYQQLDFSISVNQDIFEKLVFTPNEDLKVKFPPKKKIDNILKKGRTIRIESTGGATICSALGLIGGTIGGAGGLIGGVPGGVYGAMLGAAIGSSIGSAIGALLGGTKGCYDALTKYDQLDINKVTSTLKKYIHNSMIDINTGIRNGIDELQLIVNSSFDQQLKRQVESLRENAAQLQTSIRATANEIPQKRGALEAQNTQLKQQLEQYEALEKAISGLGRMGGTEKSGPEPVEGETGEKISYGFL